MVMVGFFSWWCVCASNKQQIKATNRPDQLTHQPHEWHYLPFPHHSTSCWPGRASLLVFGEFYLKSSPSLAPLLPPHSIHQPTTPHPPLLRPSSLHTSRLLAFPPINFSSSRRHSSLGFEAPPRLIFSFSVLFLISFSRPFAFYLVSSRSCHSSRHAFR